MALEQLDSYVKLVKDLRDSGLLYQCLLDFGKDIDTDIDIRTQQNFVNGCQSQVWITGSCKNDIWSFKFDSDAIMVKGLGKIILDTYNGLNKDQISAITFHQFKPLAATLSTQRQRGLQAIINKIHRISHTGETQ
jgi:cysteine desulfuration protein SufE